MGNVCNVHMSCLIVHFGINSHNISVHTLKIYIFLLAVEKELKKFKPVPGKLEEPKRTVNEDTGNGCFLEYSLIWYKNYVRVEISMKLLYSVVCISILNV